MHDLPKTSDRRRDGPFRLGDLEVLPASGELRSRRGTQRLRPLLMDILVRLAAEPGEVVRRETLLEDVWPRRMVNDEVLSRAIAELRTVLGDDARVARYIETLPKLGYRLVAPVQPLEPAASPSAANEAIAPGAPANDVPPRRRSRKLPAAVIALVVMAAIAGAAVWLVRDEAGNLGALEAKLLTARPLTSDPGLELGPRFSPDGTRVAFSLLENDDSRVVVQDVDGSRRQFVGDSHQYTHLFPVFFPDGRRLAYWKGSEKDCGIVEHDLETGLEKTILDCTLKPRARFDVSRDGRWLVFAGAQRPQFPASLWLLEIGSGAAPVALTSPEPGRGEDLLPRFSPDGAWIVFFRGVDARRVPWVMRRDDPSSARPAAKVEGQSYGGAWLGPAGPLVVAGDWLQFRALNAVDLHSGQVRFLGARGAKFPDVGPHGEIVYEAATYASNVWVLDVARGPDKAPLWRTTRYTTQPEFSPDGRSVAFASNRDGLDAIYVGELDGPVRRVAAGESMRYASPHWSRDGRTVYAARAVARKPSERPLDQVVRVPAAGGPVEPLTALGDHVDDVVEGDDGLLYWGETSGLAMRLSRAPLADLARAERLPLPIVDRYQLVGEHLYFTQPHLTMLTRCRLDTLACEPLPGITLRDFDHQQWSAGTRSVFLRVRDTEGKARLARYDLASRNLTQSWDLAPTANGASIAVGPDESRVVVAREEPPAIDLMIAR